MAVMLQQQRGLETAQVGCAAGPLRWPSGWLSGLEPRRARWQAVGRIFEAGLLRLAVNSAISQLSFRFQKLNCLVVFLVLFAVLI
jgi:hypothetical protein